MKNRLTILAAVLGLLAMSGLALAAETEDDPDDTVFNYGYDEENNVLVWGTSEADGTDDCTLENGEIEVTYGVADGLVIPIPLLEECGVTGVDVTGPNDQINHGMFLKAINSVYDGTGRGCVNRHIAQSDLGKGAPDVDPDGTGVAEGDTGTVDFTTVLADCQHGKETELTGQDVAADHKAAAAEKERGNSNSAPGRSGSSPGKSGSAQSNSDSAPGKSGSAPGRNK